MRSLAAILTAIWAGLAMPAVAGDNPVVVELFTSQGCSSCPPADLLMHKLAERDDVIGLALHVDYWDYIGWKDEFALPGHTVRQQGYARAGGRSMIYTPQMIVNGQQDVVGARAMDLMDLIALHQAQTPRATVSARHQTGQAVLSLTSADLQPGRYGIFLVHFTPVRHARIRRGELAGHDFDYANVVSSWTRVGDWDGQGALTIETAIEGDLPAAVLVQRDDLGPIVAAALLQ